MAAKTRWKRVGLALLAMTFAGCASTSITSQVNRDLAGREIRKVLVHGDFQNLKHQQLAEQKLCAELVRISDCECLKSSSVFFPGQSFTEDEVISRLSELEVDAVLTLQPTESGTSSTHVPKTSYTTGTATAYGNTAWGSSTTQTYGGYDITKPWAEYEAILESTSDGKVAWYASASSGGNGYAGWEDLIISASTKTASQLVSDGVLRRLEKRDRSRR